MKRCHFALFFIFTSLVFGTVFSPLMAGGPPLVTDDTGTPGHNQWEINLAYTRAHTIHERTSEISLDANYGLGERTQLNLVIPYVFSEHDEDGSDDDLGDIVFATKYRFFDEQGWFPSISTTPTISLPTSNDHSRADFFIPLEFDLNINFFYIGSQFGYVFHRDKEERNDVFYGFFCEHPVFEKIDLVGEIYGFITEKDEADLPHLNGGFRYNFSESFSIMCAAGRSFEAKGSGESHFIGYAGIRINL